MAHFSCVECFEYVKSENVVSFCLLPHRVKTPSFVYLADHESVSMKFKSLKCEVLSNMRSRFNKRVLTFERIDFDR